MLSLFRKGLTWHWLFILNEQPSQGSTLLQCVVFNTTCISTGSCSIPTQVKCFPQPISFLLFVKKEKDTHCIKEMDNLTMQNTFVIKIEDDTKYLKTS